MHNPVTPLLVDSSGNSVVPDNTDGAPHVYLSGGMDARGAYPQTLYVSEVYDAATTQPDVFSDIYLYGFPFKDLQITRTDTANTDVYLSINGNGKGILTFVNNEAGTNTFSVAADIDGTNTFEMLGRIAGSGGGDIIALNTTNLSIASGGDDIVVELIY